MFKHLGLKDMIEKNGLVALNDHFKSLGYCCFHLKCWLINFDIIFKKKKKLNSSRINTRQMSQWEKQVETRTRKHVHCSCKPKADKCHNKWKVCPTKLRTRKFRSKWKVESTANRRRETKTPRAWKQHRPSTNPMPAHASGNMINRLKISPGTKLPKKNQVSFKRIRLNSFDSFFLCKTFFFWHFFYHLNLIDELYKECLRWLYSIVCCIPSWKNSRRLPDTSKWLRRISTIFK